MRCIEMKDMGRRDEKGVVFNRTIVGKTGETKPTGTYEDRALREGDFYLEYGDSGLTVYIYDEAAGAWVEA